MAADVRYTIREAMRNKELVVHYRQNLESNHRQCKFPQLTALFHPNKSCRRRNQMDKQGFKSTTRSEFGVKRSQVQILSPRPKNDGLEIYQTVVFLPASAKTCCLRNLGMDSGAEGALKCPLEGRSGRRCLSAHKAPFVAGRTGLCHVRSRPAWGGRPICGRSSFRIS